MVEFQDTVPPPTPLADGADPINTGTPVDESWYDDLVAALSAQLHSAADPTKMPSDIIAEMFDARGTFDTLDERLQGVVDEDGNPVAQVLPSAIRNQYVLGNLLANDTFMLWSRGDSAAPDYWTLSGTGAAVARTGVGQADTQVLPGQDHFAAKLTYGSASAVLSQYPISAAAQARMGGGGSGLTSGILNHNRPSDGNATAIPGYEEFADEELYGYAIAFVWSDGTSRARIGIRAASGAVSYSEYHSGGGDWELKIVGPVRLGDNIAGTTGVVCTVDSTGSAYFQCVALVCTPSLAVKPIYVPAKVRYATATIPYIDNPASGIIGYVPFARPAFILGAQMLCTTAPGGTVPTLDLLTPISGTFQSMFVTKPQITAAQLSGSLQACDPAAADYRRRCVRGSYTAAAALGDGAMLRVDYVDDGSGTLRGLVVVIHYLEYDIPFNQFRAMTDVSEA